MELVEDGSNDTLIATWTGHPKQEQCGIEYAVTYGDSSVNETTITNETSTSFDISYCTTVFVIVEAVSADVISRSSLVTYNTGKVIRLLSYLFIDAKRLIDYYFD